MRFKKLSDGIEHREQNGLHIYSFKHRNFRGEEIYEEFSDKKKKKAEQLMKEAIYGSYWR